MLGLQLYSVKDATSKDFLATLGRVGQMGYEGVQFAGFFDSSAHDVKKVLDASGLKVAGSHTPITDLAGDELKRAIEYNQKLDNKLIICPYLPEEMRRSRDDYLRLADRLNEAGLKCQEAGLQLAYHNHNFEFEKFAGETAFDILYGEAEEKLVKMELDCFWIRYAGYDPLKMIKDNSGRIVSLHIKDLIEENGRSKSTEIGNGILDIKELIQVGEKAGVDHFVVEQEDFDGDPMDSAKANISALKELI